MRAGIPEPIGTPDWTIGSVPPRIRLAHPDVGAEEIEAISRVFATGTLTKGPETKSFEREFADYHGVEHAIALANGTVALSAIYLALGIGPGDEIIVPSLTFISTATSVLHVGAIPVFADILPDIFTLDHDDVAKRITARTKAIVAVHYAGQAADLAELIEVGEEAGIPVIEDAAEAHGATYRDQKVGSWGLAGMFSFTPTKNITTGEGGIITTNDSRVAERVRLLRNHGQTSVYRHEILGWNWRMTEMQAAMGRCQLRKLPAILERKNSNAKHMAGLLGNIGGVGLPFVRNDRDHTYMLYTLTLDSHRDQLLEALNAVGIEARVYFPAVHLQPLFQPIVVDLPVTDELQGKLLSVPFHSHISHLELDDVATTIMNTLAQSSRDA